MKIGLLANGTLSEFRVKTLSPILADQSFDIKVAIIDRRAEKSLKQKLFDNIKRGRGGYIFIMAFKRIFLNKEQGICTEEFCDINQIEVVQTKRPYAKTTIDLIKSYKLDILILVGGFGIIKEPLLSATPKGVLSYHHGNMRKYRGMPPALWELYHGENEMGVTVQILASGIDCGIPVEEKSIKIKRTDTLKRLQNRALDQSIDMLYKALIKVSDKEFTPEQIDVFGRVYTLPNFRQWIMLHAKVLWRQLS